MIYLQSLPYGERFPCEIAKSAENIPKNRFKTTFPCKNVTSFYLFVNEANG